MGLDETEKALFQSEKSPRPLHRSLEGAPFLEGILALAVMQSESELDFGREPEGRLRFGELPRLAPDVSFEFSPFAIGHAEH